MSNVATKPKTKVAYRSACPNLLLIRVSEDEEIVGAHGKRKIKGFSYQFVSHILQVSEGEDVLEDGNDPETGEPVFQDAVQWLRGKAAGLHPSQPEWFQEELPPVPPPSVALNAILHASIAKDADELARILDEERGSHNREEVVQAAMDAFRALDDEAVTVEPQEEYPPGEGGAPESQELED